MSVIVAGVDIGSLYTKAVVLRVNTDGEKPLIVSQLTLRSGSLYKSTAHTALDEALRLANLTKNDVCSVVTTGYGRYVASFGDRVVTELSCHARGANFLFPDVHTLIDIGGQDSKAIKIDDVGGVENFVMNDKCAAGTGRFLEVMAQALEVELSQMGDLSLRSEKAADISSVCTVFAESEVISLLAEGRAKEDIIAGIHKAIASRIMGMLGKVTVKQRVAMSGGVAKNIGMVEALEKRLNTKILVAENPEIVGALGAALFAAKDSQN